MIETGVYPEKFKISKITPIYKKNERTNIANYRSISLLPTLSKKFERVIHAHTEITEVLLQTDEY